MYNNNYVWKGEGPNIIFINHSLRTLLSTLGFLRQYSACITDNQPSKSVSCSMFLLFYVEHCQCITYIFFAIYCRLYEFCLPDTRQSRDNVTPWCCVYGKYILQYLVGPLLDNFSDVDIGLWGRAIYVEQYFFKFFLIEKLRQLTHVVGILSHKGIARRALPASGGKDVMGGGGNRKSK